MLVLSRDSVIAHLNEVIVVPATRTIRGIETEVVLTPDDGMPTARAVNFDHVSIARKERVGAMITNLQTRVGRSRTGAADRLRIRPLKLTRFGSYFRRGLVRFAAPQLLLKQEPVYGIFLDFGRPVRERRTGRLRIDPRKRALEWRRLLESGQVESRAALARRFGVSRARVTQVLALGS